METAVIQTPEFERTQTTDPREAKLRDIIEKGKASLHKALEEIQHEFSNPGRSGEGNGWTRSISMEWACGSNG